MQLPKPKVFIFDGVNRPSIEIQQHTSSVIEFVQQGQCEPDSGHITGIIYKQNVYHELVALFPASLPVLSDERWHDSQYLDHFLTHLYTLQRLEQLSYHLTQHKIIEFHSRYKYLIMAHSPTGYQLTGRLVAGIKKETVLKIFFAQYKAILMEIFAFLPAKNIQVNALSHMQGYFKRKASKEEKKRLLGLINDYREGNLPITRPLDMMRELLVQYPDRYLSEQYYLEPYPNCTQIRELAYV